VYKVEMVDELEAKGETVIGFYANIGKFHNPVYADFAYLGENSTATFIDMCQ
jgi:hypothetical protein